jgi:hypothetical protein
MEYPYSSAFILNDATFLAFGGQTGTSTVAQRGAAYYVAERQMTEHIGTFLKPTTITGTYFSAFLDPLELEYGYVRSIDGVSFYSADNLIHVFTSGDITKHVLMRNWKAGYIDISCVPLGWSNCGCSPLYPYNIGIVETCGLLTGSSTAPDMLMALTMVAQINLNEIVSDFTLVNEGVGDIGVQEFSNQFYHEIRTKLGRSIFGTSAKANKAADLTRHFRARSALRFH